MSNINISSPNAVIAEKLIGNIVKLNDANTRISNKELFTCKNGKLQNVGLFQWLFAKFRGFSFYTGMVETRNKLATDILTDLEKYSIGADHSTYERVMSAVITLLGFSVYTSSDATYHAQMRRIQNIAENIIINPPVETASPENSPAPQSWRATVVSYVPECVANTAGAIANTASAVYTPVAKTVNVLWSGTRSCFGYFTGSSVAPAAPAADIEAPAVVPIPGVAVPSPAPLRAESQPDAPAPVRDLTSIKPGTYTNPKTKETRFYSEGEIQELVEAQMEFISKISDGRIKDPFTMNKEGAVIAENGAIIKQAIPVLTSLNRMLKNAEHKKVLTTALTEFKPLWPSLTNPKYLFWKGVPGINGFFGDVGDLLTKELFDKNTKQLTAEGKENFKALCTSLGFNEAQTNTAIGYLSKLSKSKFQDLLTYLIENSK